MIDGGYSVAKATGLYPNASPASLTQAYWEERGWVDTMIERVFPFIGLGDNKTVSDLGSCIMDSDYFKKQKVDEKK